VNHFYVNNTECEADLMSSGRLFLQAFEILSSGQVLIGVLRQLCIYSHTTDIDEHKHSLTYRQTETYTEQFATVITHGPHSFAVSGPCVWNDLLPTWCASLGTLKQFQSTLKTILFCSAYAT